MLVYQAGLANVFQVDSFNLCDFGREAKRLLQSDFRSCEWFARGLVADGAKVTTVACNMAGDITHQKWNDDLQAQPFSTSFSPIYSKNVQSTDNRF